MLRIDSHNGSVLFQTPFDQTVWHNFAVAVDWNALTLQVFYSQNVRTALLASDRGIVLELGQVQLQDRARALIDDARVAQLYMGVRAAGNAGGT